MKKNRAPATHMNLHGCSTCPPGEERFESYGWEHKVQYDYRTGSGILFSTVAWNLAECRRQRDEWLRRKGFDP